MLVGDIGFMMGDLSKDVKPLVDKRAALKRKVTVTTKKIKDDTNAAEVKVFIRSDI